MPLKATRATRATVSATPSATCALWRETRVQPGRSKPLACDCEHGLDGADRQADEHRCQQYFVALAFEGGINDTAGNGIPRGGKGDEGGTAAACDRRSDQLRQAIATEGEEGDEGDAGGADAAAREGQVDGQDQRRQNRGGGCAEDRATSVRGQLQHQRQADRDETGEPVPVVDRVSKSFLGTGQGRLRCWRQRWGTKLGAVGTAVRPERRP